jgi:hypothetical protein
VRRCMPFRFFGGDQVRLISAEEELADVSHELIIEASTKVATALLLCNDHDSYAAAVAAMKSIPPTAWWLLELIVEAELAANRMRLHYPSGIRGAAS